MRWPLGYYILVLNVGIKELIHPILIVDICYYNNTMTKKTKQTPGELIFGINPILEVLKARKRKLISIYTTKPEPKGFAQIQKLMPAYPVAIQYVARDVLHRMAGTTDHQGIIAWVHHFGFRQKPFEAQKQPLLIMLDGIQDPRNVGAIIRSAYCAGVDGVILPQKNSSALTGVAFKSSAGLAEHMQIYQPASSEAAVQELKAAGYVLYLAVFDGTDARAISFKQPACLVVGSEGFGISSSLLRSGEHITIPQRSADISYNVSVAAGILLFLMSSQAKRI